MKPYCDSCEHADLKRTFCLFYQDEISKVKAKCEIDFRENIKKEVGRNDRRKTTTESTTTR